MLSKQNQSICLYESAIIFDTGINKTTLRMREINSEYDNATDSFHMLYLIEEKWHVACSFAAFLLKLIPHLE